jgi:hypothetical protein
MRFAIDALRPLKLPLPITIALSNSPGRNPQAQACLKMRFSAAKYSFCSSSWLTNPVTQAKSRVHVVVLVLNIHHRKPGLSQHSSILTICQAGRYNGRYSTRGRFAGKLSLNAMRFVSDELAHSVSTLIFLSLLT